MDGALQQVYYVSAWYGILIRIIIPALRNQAAGQG
jgi:hypothetical protein